MPITSIELNGYRRMRLKSIRRIHIQFTERLQLILGTNGSGKSALIAELSPLPADPTYYAKDGYKVITYTHLGKDYVLRSTMSPSPRHSFRCEGQELNHGGTQTQQKELVKQIFGITPDIHDLLTGLERFTSMAASDRRRWFTLLSDVSWDYALKKFKQLQERARDIKGATNLAKKRLAIEAGRIISEEEQLKLTTEIDRLHSELDVLQAERAPRVQQSHLLADEQARMMLDLEELIGKTRKLRILLMGRVHYTSMEELEAGFEANKAQTAATKALLDRAVKEHDTLESQFEILKQTGEAGLAVLQERLNQKRQEIQTILDLRRLKLEGIEPETGLGAIAAVRDALTEVFMQLPANADRRFSQIKFKEDETTLLSLKERKLRQEHALAQLAAQKAHQDSHKKNAGIECPKCGHHWIQGYSEEGYSKLLDAKEKLEQELDITLKGIQTAQEAMTAFEEYRFQYNGFVRCTRAWPVLQPFWDHLLDNNLIVSAPRQAQALVETLEHDLQHGLHAKQVEQEARELMALIERAANLGDENLTNVTRKLVSSTESIEVLTATLTQLAQEHQGFVALRRNLVEYQSLGEKLVASATAVEMLTEQQIEALRREIIHETIRQIQVQLATLTKTLSEVEHQKRTVGSLTANIEEMEFQEEAARMLVTALSPTEGLIAQGLMGSIQAFTSEMNYLIRRVWTYPLEILPCGVSTELGAELDYKFPMLVQTEDHIVPDVKTGSGGQREIIDLAFRIIATKKLKLLDAPLILDEFGKDLDDVHQKSASFAIQTLVEQQLFQQVFMVSHYEASYGALTQAEICVLCADNILLPKDKPYNQHVTIEN